MSDFKQALIAAMNAAGIMDPDQRAGIAAIIFGETGFKPQSEASYAHTDNARIREIFHAVAMLSDADLSALKLDDRQFFDFVYGGKFGNRPGTDDGYAYRGRGPFQLTFRDNYAKIGARIGKDLVGNPELVNDDAVGAETAVAYFQTRYRGDGWEEMKACVGFNTPDIAARKDRAYAKFRASGEFAVLEPPPDTAKEAAAPAAASS